MSAAKKSSKKREWTKQDSAEFQEHLEERGFAIVSKTEYEKQKQFIAHITQGLNLALPENQGRPIAVVWKDHIDMLNDVARVVIAIGMTTIKAETQERETGSVDDETKSRLQQAQGILSGMARELAERELEAQSEVKTLEVDANDERAKELLGENVTDNNG